MASREVGSLQRHEHRGIDLTRPDVYPEMLEVRGSERVLEPGHRETIAPSGTRVWPEGQTPNPAVARSGIQRDS